MAERRIVSGDIVFVRQAEFSLPGTASIDESLATSLLCHSDRHGLSIVAVPGIPGSSGASAGLIIGIPLADLEPSFDGAEARQELPESASVHNLPQSPLEIALSASENLLAARFSSSVCVYAVQDILSKVQIDHSALLFFRSLNLFETTDLINRNPL
jgi:hypothetical protein